MQLLAGQVCRHVPWGVFGPRKRDDGLPPFGAVRGLAGWRSLESKATPCLSQEVASPFGEQGPAMYGKAGPMIYAGIIAKNDHVVGATDEHGRDASKA